MSEMIEVSGEHPIPAYLAQPKGAAHGAVIVIHEVWGLSDHIKSVADRVAAAGYIALAPNLLSQTDIEAKATPELQQALFDPERRSQIQPQLRELMAPLQDPAFGAQTATALKACFEYLYELPAAKQRVAVMGFCFGGTYSFTLATLEPRLKAAIAFYGHSHHNTEELMRIACPVLALYGETDERLISGLGDLTEQMQAAGVDFTSHVYPDCGHAFFNDSNPYAYNAAAAKDAWKRTLELLAKALNE
jgi:carboxymethylenebutenolidase